MILIDEEISPVRVLEKDDPLFGEFSAVVEGEIPRKRFIATTESLNDFDTWSLAMPLRVIGDVHAQVDFS